MFIKFLEYLKELLKGRGFFASFLVISGWVYILILIFVLIFQLLLSVIGAKPSDKQRDIWRQEDEDKNR
jgi:hypothetical protein